MGTVTYAAPEQLMGGDIDARADQYALAATAFQLLTGAPPYQHSNPVAVISQHLTAPLPKLSDWRPELTGLDQVLSGRWPRTPTTASRNAEISRPRSPLEDSDGDRVNDSRIPVVPKSTRRGKSQPNLAITVPSRLHPADGVPGRPPDNGGLGSYSGWRSPRWYSPPFGVAAT